MRTWRSRCRSASNFRLAGSGLGFKFGAMDEAELFKQLEGRAGAGDAEAMYELGWRSALGMGLPADENAGLKWLNAAAEAGHMLAQNNLGARHLAGDGVEQSNLEAYIWFSLAAAQGDRKAGKNRDSVGGSLTPEELDEARRRLREKS